MTKQELVAKAKEQGLEVSGKETVAELQALVALQPGNQGGSEDAPVPSEQAAPEPVKVEEPQLDPSFTRVHAPAGSKAAAMRDALKAQPKVRVFIPLASGEKQGVTQSVILNGYPLYIRKGEYVDVPQQVAEILEVKMKHKLSIENHPSRIKADGEVKLTPYGG